MGTEDFFSIYKWIIFHQELTRSFNYILISTASSSQGLSRALTNTDRLLNAPGLHSAHLVLSRTLWSTTSEPASLPKEEKATFRGDAQGSDRLAALCFLALESRGKP